MATVSVSFRTLSGNLDLDVDEDSTISQVKAAATTLGLNVQGLSLLSGGQRLSDDDTVSADQVIVGTPPEAKHGVTA